VGGYDRLLINDSGRLEQVLQDIDHFLVAACWGNPIHPHHFGVNRYQRANARGASGGCGRGDRGAGEVAQISEWIYARYVGNSEIKGVPYAGWARDPENRIKNRAKS
jgi:hypothetical protein